MFVSVTRLKVRSFTRLPLFFLTTFKSMSQAKKAKGLIQVTARKFEGLNFYTLTAWENKQAMLDYRNSGSHLHAMQITGKVADATQVTGFESEKMPTWEEAL